LAWQIFRASPEQIRMQSDQQKSLGTLYRRGIIMNLTNPKVSIFFLAFLPQFADPVRGPVSLQMIVLGGIFIIATILVFGVIALIGGVLGDWLNRSERVQRAMNWTAGTIFVSLALKLVTAER
jgi:threonine/homoserine/homoserine lactone efflux protein